MALTLKLPRKHAEDWANRCDSNPQVMDKTARTITMRLTDNQVTDLISDCHYYIDCMYGEWTDGVDYRSAAVRCLRALQTQTGRQG